MSQQIVSVNRGDVSYEAAIRWTGRYYPASRLSPEEWPDPSIDKCWVDGVPLLLIDMPDDVAEEILQAAFDDPGEEPDEDEGF